MAGDVLCETPRKGVLVVRFAGSRFTTADHIQGFQALVGQANSEGRAIIIDASQLTHLSKKGLEAWVHALDTAAKRVILCAIRDLGETAHKLKLPEIFVVAESVEDALARYFTSE